jgi:LacI family transcriptional regulator
LTKKLNFTIRDIAKESGVSIATVSRFINNSGYVEVETKKRIKENIDKFGYKPSIIVYTNNYKRGNLNVKDYSGRKS